MNFSCSSNSGETTSTVRENHDIGPCRVCGLLTGQYCKRCGDYYCSTECQSIDWPKHRYICFPKPPLVRRRGSVFAEDGVFPVEHTREVEGYSFILKELNEFKVEVMNKLTELAGNKTTTTTATTSWEAQYIDENLDDSGPKPDENPKDISTNDEEISYSAVVNDEINLDNTALENDISTQEEEVSKFDLNTSSYLNQSQQFDMIDTITSNSINDDNKESPCFIVLCAFRSTNRCAIRKKDSETTKIYHEVLEKIDNYGKTAPQMQEMPAFGSYAITFKMGNLHTRVKVLKTESEDKIRVNFCDYGNTVCRKLSQLHVITPEIANLPTCMKTVQLHGVNMTKMNEQNMAYLKGFERKTFKMEYIWNDEDIDYVNLYDITTGELLNDVIAKFFAEYEKTSIVNTPKEKRRILNGGDLSSCCDENKKTVISESEKEKVANEPVIKNKKNDIPKPSINALQPSNINKNSEEKTSQHQNAKKKIKNMKVVSLNAPPFQQHPFSEGWTKKIKAVIVDISEIHNGYIACIPKGDLAHLSKVQEFLNKIDYKNEPYKPRLNEYCVAQYENEWYRGLVVDIVDDGGGGTKYEIRYVDFMNGAVLTSQYIRPYPEDLQIGCYTSLCKFDNLPKALNDKQREFLKSSYDLNDIFIINRVVEVRTDDNVAVIECNSIISRMIEKDLI